MLLKGAFPFIDTERAPVGYTSGIVRRVSLLIHWIQWRPQNGVAREDSNSRITQASDTWIF